MAWQAGAFGWAASGKTDCGDARTDKVEGLLGDRYAAFWADDSSGLGMPLHGIAAGGADHRIEETTKQVEVYLPLGTP